MSIIVVSSGTYEEQVDIRKPVTLRSEAVDGSSPVVNTTKRARTIIRRPADGHYAIYVYGGHNGADRWRLRL